MLSRINTPLSSARVESPFSEHNNRSDTATRPGLPVHILPEQSLADLSGRLGKPMPALLLFCCIPPLT